MLWVSYFLIDFCRDRRPDCPKDNIKPKGQASTPVPSQLMRFKIRFIHKNIVIYKVLWYNDLGVRKNEKV